MNTIVKIGGVVAIVIIIAAVALAARSNQEAQKLRRQIEELRQQAQGQEQQQSPEEVQKLVDEVSKLIVLPEGETPTVAEITDREKLKEVAFFSKAENGDKVLLYVNSRRAYLYRPSAARIIDVAVVNLTAVSPSPGTSPGTSPITSPRATTSPTGG